MFLQGRDYIRTPADDAADAAELKFKRDRAARLAREFERTRFNPGRWQG